ncbi:MAG: prs [Candidatus Taylorbacteria bacterium]|nr:prs [Candidatus Taylorbacteria bacterium]
MKKNSGIKLIGLSAHPKLAKDIAKQLKTNLVHAEVARFPDEEISIQIQEHIRGCDVFIIQPTCPPCNDNLMELLIMVDAARRSSADRITAVIPFFGYARQDRKDKPRVPITAKLVANLLVTAGVDRVLTMDLHAGQIQGFFDIPVDHLYARPVFIKEIKKRKIKDLVVVSPDTGAVKMAHAYSKLLGAPLAIVAKNRIGADEVEAISIVGDVKGKNALLVDDMTGTAGTLVEAAKIIQRNGGKDVYAAVSHAILSDIGRKRLKESTIKEIFTTDSAIQAFGPKVTTLSIAPLLAEAIKRIHNDESVTSLF